MNLIEQFNLEDERCDKFGFPEDCSISLRVPGGGDYSNCDIDVDNLSVTYEEKEEHNK